ncbi:MULTISPECIES: MarR family winged helix-turn-helix transcriptional regulator [Mycolicibacterium]|uniref:Transcriptional regulator, MarR family n=3 Tax=unclassified Mycobacterium TaxID=2642494 RepID=A0A5Q5BDM1_MYCSS|nr:MarR family winged helix-turn-helix transcriptional regulator [Mycolicibacterium monacense]OBB61627.1 MarR family transcriptional regulator [Mycolicibacterium monacense]OBF58465.1 MarR family transcriptional regulator [Mycolicibacterium monacense]
MYSVWLSDEEQQVWRGYLAMVAELQAAMNRQLQHDCGLSLADYEVLVALSERGGRRMYELGETLAWEQSRLSHQLRRMRERGLVSRRGATDDRRGATVALTDAGRAALRTAAPGHAALVRRVLFDGMPTARRKAFSDVIDTVRERLRDSPV